MRLSFKFSLALIALLSAPAALAGPPLGFGGGGALPPSVCGDASHALAWNGSTFTCQAITGGTAAAGTPANSLQYNQGGAISGVSGTSSNGVDVTFGDGNLKLTGATSGTAVLKAPATGGGTVTLPTGTDTVVGRATTDTLTNKSIDASEVNSGTLGAARLPLATTGAFGAVKPDGTTVTISGGVISSTGGGGGAPTGAAGGDLGGTYPNPTVTSGANIGAATIPNSALVTDPTNASNLSSGTVGAARLPLATTGAFGAVKPDGTTVTISGGVITSVAGGSTGANPSATIGAAAVNGSASTFMRSDAAPPLPATLPALDGSNLTNLNGSNVATGTVPAARLPLATTGAFGAVKPDGSTVTISAGVISAVGGSATTVQAASTSPAITVNGGTGACTTTCNIGIQEALSPNSGSFANASYTIQATDLGTILPRTRTSAMTDTMPDVGTTGFGQGVSVVICTGPIASAAQDTVTRASSSKFMIGDQLANSVVIPPGACAKFTNSQNTNWAVSGIPFIDVGTMVISRGTNKALLYDNNAVVGEVAPVNNAVVSTNGSGVPSESTTLPSGLTIPNATLTAPALGTVASGDLTSATNYPVASLSGLGSNVGASLALSASGSSGGFCRSVGSACSGQAGGGANVYSSGAVTIAANTYFAPFGGGGAPVTTETAVQTNAPAASTVANLQVRLSVDPGNTNTVVVTVRNNASDQTATCTITGNGTTALSCSDTTHSFNPAQGDKLDFKIVNSASFTGTINISATWGTTNVGMTGYNVTVPARQTATSCNTSTSATCAITDNNQNANLVFSGPSSGGAAAPTFRALVAADIPTLPRELGPNYISGNYYSFQPGAGMNATTSAFTTTTMRWAPFFVTGTPTIDKLCANVTTLDSGKSFNLSIYANGTNNLPTGSNLTNTGSLSTTTATQVCNASALGFAFPAPGLYWMGAQSNSTVAIFSGVQITSSNFAAGYVGASTLANLFASSTVIGTTWNTTGGTFGTFPTNPSVTEANNTTTQMPYVVMQVH